MSKKRKGGGKHHGGGSVTPKGTRPGQPTPPHTPADPFGSGPAAPFELPDPFGEDPFGPGGPHIDDLFGGGPFGGDPFDGPSAELGADELLDSLVSGLVDLDPAEPLIIEMWGSSFVGSQRAGLRPPSPFEPVSTEPLEHPPSEEEFFGLLVERFAARGEAEDGAIFLDAIAAIEPYLGSGAPEAAAAAREATARLSRLHGPPAWADTVGHAVVERCFVIDHETDDGHNIGLVARHPGASEPHLLMVLIDVNMGDMAKDVLVSDQVDAILAEALTVEGLTLHDLDPAVARARIEAGLARTDMTIDAPVSEDFDEARPMVEHLLATLPPAAPIEEPEPRSREELDTVVEQLLDAPETAASTLPRDQLLQTATLTVQFVSQWCGRPSLSWSPTRLDMFLGDFVPTKVSAPPDELQHLPQALIDLVPAAHRLNGWGDRHVQDAIDAIELVTPVFREALAEPDVAGPAKQMMMRAIAEGIDIEDPDQLAALMARVNAMGGVDVFASGEDLSSDEDLEFPEDD